MKKISGLAPLIGLITGIGSRATLLSLLVIIMLNGSLIRIVFLENLYRNHFGVQENQMVLGIVVVC